MTNRVEELMKQLQEAQHVIRSLSEENMQLSTKYHEVKEEIFDLHGTIMMATVEAKHEAEKELIANRAELNLKNNEIKDLQRDLRKLKKLHEDTTKEVNELRQTATVKQSQNHETTQSFAPLQFSYQAIPFNKSSETILLEVSISFQQLNSQLSQNIQIFQLLETEFIASTKLTLHSSPKRHKYLTQLDPAQEEKIERHDPSMNFTPGISKSIQNVLEMAKLTLYEAVSLLEQIFVSLTHGDTRRIATDIYFYLIEVLHFLEYLFHLIPFISQPFVEKSDIINHLVQLISGSYLSLCLGYQAMDSLAPSMDPIPPELSVQSSENTKRKRDTVDSVDGMYSCHVQLAVPLLHSLTEGLTLAHFPNFRKENKQTLMTSIASILIFLCQSSAGIGMLLHSPSEMKLKLLYSIIQSDDSSGVKYYQKSSLLTNLVVVLEGNEKAFDEFISEELKCQQSDSAYDTSGSNDQMNRRRIVSFCKYLCRIFDSTVSEYELEHSTTMQSLVQETIHLLHYKFRLVCFLIQLIRRYGKRAVDCFLGLSVTPMTSSRKNSSNYRLILPAICRLCVQTIQDLEKAPIENVYDEKREIEVKLVQSISQFLLAIEESLQESSLKKLIETSKSSELLDTILWRVYYNRLPIGVNPSDWSTLVDLFDD